MSRSRPSPANYRFKRRCNDMLAEEKLTIEAYSALIDAPAYLVYRWFSEGSPNAYPAYKLPIHTLRVNDKLISDLAHDAQHAVVALPRTIPNWTDAMALTLRMMSDCAEVLTKFGACIGEQTLPHRKNREIVQAVRRAIEALLAVQVVADRLTTVVPRTMDD